MYSFKLVKLIKKRKKYTSQTTKRRGKEYSFIFYIFKARSSSFLEA